MEIEEEIEGGSLAASEENDSRAGRVDDWSDIGETTGEERTESDFALKIADFWYRDAMLTMKALVLPKDPKNIDEAMSMPDAEQWREAIAKELDAFVSRDIWAPAEQTGRGMKTKLILKYQFDNDYKIKHKARLVVCGYSQVYGLDYTDTYSPTTSTPIVLFILHIAASRGWKISAFDISAAYLEGKADTKMFAWLPGELMENGQRTRVEIKGNWYGEKQAGRIWNKKFDGILTSMGFQCCPMMPCFYAWRGEHGIIFLCIHVDDG